MNFSQTTAESNLKASAIAPASSSAVSTFEIPIELSSQHGLSTKGIGTVGVWVGDVRSSPCGTGTPAALATALACALSVMSAMHSGEQPTRGTPSRSNSERYAVYPGQQNMCGTQTSNSPATRAVRASPCDSLSASSIV